MAKEKDPSYEEVLERSKTVSRLQREMFEVIKNYSNSEILEAMAYYITYISTKCK
jgi:hypothetical protein